MRTIPRAASTTAILISCLGLTSVGAARAGEAEWTIELQPIYMQVSGHDPQVLAIQGTGGGSETVRLDTESTLASRLGIVRRGSGKWGFGIDFLWVETKQKAAESRSPSGGALAFESGAFLFASADPADTLFYSTLEDTVINMWTFDLLALRELSASEKGGFELLFGLRSADFDNDYRSVVGVFDIEGGRIDASSNYGRMTGALVGIAGRTRFAGGWLEGSLRQSVVFGEAELSNMTGEFTGPFEPYLHGFEDLPEDYMPMQQVHETKDVSIPITELRVDWTYPLSDAIALGVGAETSIWFGVPVPPGVSPGEGTTLSEADIALLGLFGKLRFTF